jgi:hypothetical protein
MNNANEGIQKMRALSIGTLSIFAFCSLVGPFTKDAAASPAQVLLIRHAEKPDQGSNLSQEGELRAQAYVQYFQTSPQVTRFGTPVAIYAMSPSDADSGNRPTETVAPLAQALGLPILNSFAKSDISPLAETVLSNPAYEGRMVLICWEHKMLSKIAGALGVQPEPDKWDSSVFDQVWEIDFSNDQISNFQEFTENLVLPGSSLF